MRPTATKTETARSAGDGPEASPDAWACEAAAWPVAFAQVREDPRLDLDLVRTLPSRATVVMIASGGDTAACLARSGIRRLFLVDLNPAQLALTRLKLHLAGRFPASELLRLLGHVELPASERKRRLQQHLDALELSDDVFGPIDVVAELGPDRCGRYERVFTRLAQVLAPQREALLKVLGSDDCATQACAVATHTALGAALDDALDRVMALPNLVRIFGRDATQNPEQPFARHFAQQTRDALSRWPACSNPFLWQMFAGRFPANHPYDWFLGCEPLPPAQAQERMFSCGSMRDVLDGLAAGSCDLVHLSNILDWLRPEDALATLQSARRVLRPGGVTIIRQLNSSLDVPGLPSGFHWDIDLGRRLQRADRSFFYRSIHVGRKP